MGSYKWVKNLPAPGSYDVKAWVLEEIEAADFIGEPQSEGYFSVDELKKRCFIGVYEWVPSQKEVPE